MKNYWNKRYAHRIGSGAGSVGKFRAFVQKTLDGLRIPMEKTALDYGCGDMQMWKGFPINHYTGLDFSNVIVKRNRKRFPNKEFLLPHELKGMYDVSFCISVIIHILDKEELFKILTDLAKHTRETIIISYWEQEPPNLDKSYQKYWAASEWSHLLTEYGWYFTSLHYTDDENDYNVICVYEKGERK